VKTLDCSVHPVSHKSASNFSSKSRVVLS